MLPGAIIFCNNDLTPGVQGPLLRQLYITEEMVGAEFDLRVAENPNYTNLIHSNNFRILVTRDFSDGYNRNLADIAIFIKSGLATIESNKFGPPGQTFPVDKLTIYQLLAHYPLSGTTPIPANVQNNILVPLHSHINDPKLYPFGSDAGIMRGGRGADVDIPEED